MQGRSRIGQKGSESRSVEVEKNETQWGESEIRKWEMGNSGQRFVSGDKVIDDGEDGKCEKWGGGGNGENGKGNKKTRELEMGRKEEGGRRGWVWWAREMMDWGFLME